MGGTSSQPVSNFYSVKMEFAGINQYQYTESDLINDFDDKY
jgi:hypothetical protein